jgi:hypothetical protein
MRQQNEKLIEEKAALARENLDLKQKVQGCSNITRALGEEYQVLR